MEDHNFQSPLCILTGRQALEISNHLETMLETFFSVSSLRDIELIEKFLESKKQIRIILSKSVIRKGENAGSEIQDKRMQDYWSRRKVNANH